MTNHIILNVADKKVERAERSRLLRQAGFQVLEAATGAAALEVVQQKRPHLVLLKVELPDVNGVELCRRIKTEPALTATLVFLVATTNVTDAELVQGLEAGADNYLREPVEPALLLASVTALLRLRETNQSVQTSEQRYRDLFEKSQGLICLHDLEGILLAVNPAAAEQLGYEPAEMVGQRMDQFLEPALRPFLHDYLARIRQQPTDSGLLRLMTKAGAGRIWSYHNTRCEEPGKPPYVLGHAQDITDRIQAERELRLAYEELEQRIQARTTELAQANTELRSEIDKHRQTETTLQEAKEWLTAIFAASRDGIIVEENEIIVYANNAAARILSYAAPESLVGQRFAIVPADEDRERLLEYGRQRLRGEFAPPSYEFKGQRSDRSLIDLEASVAVTTVAGKAYIVTFIRDVTARQQAERALRESETRLRALINSIDEVVFEFDEHGTFLYIGATDEQLLTRPKAEMLGRRDSELYGEEFVRPFHEAYKRVLQNGQAESIEYELEVQGGCRWFLARISPILSADGMYKTVSVLSRDITERKQAEKAVQESEARFRNLFDEAPVGYHELDELGRITRVNRTELELLGYTADEMIGRPAWQFIIDHNSQEVITAKLTGKGALGPVERTYRRKDGTEVPVLVENRLIRQADGRVTGIRATLQDISEHKQAELALRESEERYRLLFEDNPLPMMVYDLTTLKFLAVNKSAISHYGYSVAEFLNLTVCDIRPPEDVPLLLERFHQNKFISTHGEQWRHRKKDGTIIDVETTSHPANFAGRQARLVLVNDVTEQKRAQVALQAKTEQLQVITDAMTGFLQTEDWHEASRQLLRGALSQTASVYGFVGVLMEGRVLRILAHEGVVWDQEVNRDFYEQALRTYEETGYLEFTNFNNLFGQVITTGQTVISNAPAQDARAGQQPPGHPPLNSFLGVPIYRGSELVGLIGIANRPDGYTEADQTKLEVLAQMASVLYDSYLRRQRETALETQLRQAQKMEAIGQLAGGVAHDFNNLLTAITGYADLTLMQLDPADLLHNHVLEIKKSGDRAAALTRQLLAFSRKQVLKPKILDLNLVITDLDKLLRRLIGEDIDLKTTWGPSLGQVKADPSQIEQVIMNLALNARDAMPKGGKLMLETANVELDENYALTHVPVKPGRYVQLAVSDTGCGMNAEVQARIFEPFFTTKEPGKGTGLGLSTVYGIVKQSDGHIWVYSEPGHGTTFKIYLPRVDQADQRDPASLKPSRLISGTETILLVEDEELVRVMVRETLRRSGYQVLEAANGQEACQICEQHSDPIHLLLTDVVMPETSGREVALQISARRPTIKVLYMSGYTDDAIVRHGVLESHMEFIQKPFTPDSLTRKIRGVLDTPAGTEISL